MHSAEAIEKAQAVFGPVDCLVNNAGVMLLGQIDSQDAGEWQKMFDVNVIALLNGMQAVLADMKTRNTGTILNISSIAGKKAFSKPRGLLRHQIRRLGHNGKCA